MWRDFHFNNINTNNLENKMEAIKNLAKNWLLVLLVSVLGILSGIVTTSMQKHSDKVEGAASIDYVDRENSLQDANTTKVNTRQDLDLRDLHATKADKDEVNSIHEDVREIRDTQLKIYKILIDQK